MVGLNTGIADGTIRLDDDEEDEEDEEDKEFDLEKAVESGDDDEDGAFSMTIF